MMHLNVYFRTIRIDNTRTVGWMSVHKKHENTEACPLTVIFYWCIWCVCKTNMMPQRKFEGNKNSRMEVCCWIQFWKGTWLDHPFKVWLNLAEWLQKVFNWFFVKISLINMHVFVKNRQNAKSFFKSCNMS